MYDVKTKAVVNYNDEEVKDDRDEDQASNDILYCPHVSSDIFEIQFVPHSTSAYEIETNDFLISWLSFASVAVSSWSLWKVSLTII